MKFKKLSEVDAVEELSETGYVLGIDDEGEVKRVPKGTIGKVKTVNGATPDETGNVEIASSWNDLKDKPFEEMTVMGDTLTWDGNTTGKEVVSYSSAEGVIFEYVRVSDCCPTYEELQKGGSAVSSDGLLAEFTDAMVVKGSDALYGLQNAAMIATEDDATFNDLIFPKKGLYLQKAFGRYITELKINDYQFEVEYVETINPKYLPNCVFAYGE